MLLCGEKDPFNLPENPLKTRVLMIRRKDSMSYMEFIRGKYDVSQLDYLKKLLSNMTTEEQSRIVCEEFDTLWTKLWGVGRDTRSNEYEVSKSKFYMIDRNRLVQEVPSQYTEPEWGFPKGRRMKDESDINCAIREFYEETNVVRNAYCVCSNLSFSETFEGTNNVMYKHTYFVALLQDSKLVDITQTLTGIQRREVSAIEWKTMEECRQIIRPHYAERKKMVDDLERAIGTFETLPHK